MKDRASALFPPRAGEEFDARTRARARAHREDRANEKCNAHAEEDISRSRMKNDAVENINESSRS